MITDSSSNDDTSNSLDTAYPDNKFSNALERDGQKTGEEQYDDSALEQDEVDEDLEEDEALDPDDLDDDLTERYDENDREPEPETFSDDGYKID
ncbi:hypothetical protein D3C86_1561110 [compost metagenome]|jgi:hypothetical protein